MSSSSSLVGSMGSIIRVEYCTHREKFIRDSFRSLEGCFARDDVLCVCDFGESLSDAELFDLGVSIPVVAAERLRILGVPVSLSRVLVLEQVDTTLFVSLLVERPDFPPESRKF